jgi:hypothetical protein
MAACIGQGRATEFEGQSAATTYVNAWHHQHLHSRSNMNTTGLDIVAFTRARYLDILFYRETTV